MLRKICQFCSIHLVFHAETLRPSSPTMQADANSGQPLLDAIRKRLYVSFVPAPGSSEMQIREPEWISGQLRAARGGQIGGLYAEAGSGVGGAVAPVEAHATTHTRKVNSIVTEYSLTWSD